ncbi:MAG: TolC family protein [Deltaproteobacteria bacterium]|nr:TolC family protein [Deltaproteobacteria bacterium]
MHFREGVQSVTVLLFLAFLCPVIASAGVQDAAVVPSTVSFEEAVRTALSNAREVKLAVQDVRISAEGKTRAEAGRLPRLDASTDYTMLSEPPGAIIQNMTVQTSERNVWRGRANATQTIYDFGRTRSLVDQAQARVETAENVEGLTRERQAMEVISAFLSARRAEELRQVADESLTAAKDHRRVAGNQYDFGVVAKNDVLAAEVQVANAESVVIVAENQVELSRSRLALRMGYSGERSVTPASGPFPAPPETLPSLEESLRAALVKRSELRVQDASVREGEAALAGARAEFAPTFFGQGGYQYEDNDFNPHKSVFSLVVGGKVNLFSGFSDEAAKRQALLSIGRRKEGLLKLRDEISLEVKAAHLSVTEAAKRKAVAEAAVARAEENLRIQNDRYKEGLAISTEALDAQTLLTRAKVDLRNAAYDLHESRYRLLAARGELLEFLIPLTGAGR